MNFLVYPINSDPYGKAYSEWAEEWIKWALSIPKAVNPIVDLTGRYCCEGQTYPVWFLAGTFGNSVRRKCEIPPEAAIFFPIIEKECSFAEEGDQLKTDSELCDRATHLMDLVTELKVTIDGVDISNLKEYRMRSRVFDLVFNSGNVYDVTPGVTRSVTDGYWLFLKPLPIGYHTVFFRASALIPEGPAAQIAKRYVETSGNIFKTEVQYDLFVN